MQTAINAPNCLMVTGPAVVELTLVTKGRMFTMEKTSNPSLVWKKADVFTINIKDDDAWVGQLQLTCRAAST